MERAALIFPRENFQENVWLCNHCLKEIPFLKEENNTSHIKYHISTQHCKNNITDCFFYPQDPKSNPLKYSGRHLDQRNCWTEYKKIPRQGHGNYKQIDKEALTIELKFENQSNCYICKTCGRYVPKEKKPLTVPRLTEMHANKYHLPESQTLHLKSVSTKPNNQTYISQSYTMTMEQIVTSHKVDIQKEEL